MKKLLNNLTSFGGKANPALTRFNRFTFVGIFTFLSNIFLLYFFTDILNINYIASTIISFMITLTLAYSINIKWGYVGTEQKIFKGYRLFLAIDLLTLLIVLVLMIFFVGTIGIHYIFSRITSGIIAGTINFILNSKLTFKMPIFK